MPMMAARTPMTPARTPMTARERVRATVAGLPVDAVPVMTWLNPHAGCRLMAEFQPASDSTRDATGRRLWEQFSRGSASLSEEERAFAPLLYMGYVNQEYALDLGSDLVSVGLPIDDLGRRLPREDEGGSLYIQDAFGSVRRMASVYLEVVEPAVKEIKDLVELPLPDASSEKPYDRIRKFRAEHPDACLYGESFGVQDFPSTQIWEMSQFMLALYDYPDEVKQFQARFNDYMIGISRRMVAAGADVILIYDDYGTSGAPLTSVEMWKEFTYPHLRKHIEAVHDADAIAMLHSCGYQMPFLRYYVDAELDILQSLQPKAGNDFAAAHAEFGDRLTFSTGVDVQRGETMTPEELREDILRAYRIGGRNGHHILGYTHMLQYTMPAENIDVILRTVREIQAGVHDA
jgi:uroporphyrinogen-III decarboxylase